MDRSSHPFPIRVSAAIAAVFGVWAIELPAGEPAGLATCLDQAMRSNPRIQAAQAESIAAGLDAEAVRSLFRSPVFSASAGQTETPTEVPFDTIPFSVSDDALSAQAGVEAPLAAGVYGGAGIRQLRYRTDDEFDGDDHTAAGARLRVPLWRDRGFGLNRLEAETLSAEALAQAADAQATVLDELASVAAAYAQLLFRAADAAEVGHALERAETLEKETADRAELRDIAEYQVFPARYEAAVRREELVGAEGRVETALGDLSGAVGASLDTAAFSNELSTADAVLGDWARSAAAGDWMGILTADAAENCPEVLAARERARSRGAAVEEAVEAGRPNLDLLVGMGWDDEGVGRSDSDTGYGVAVVFSTPLSRTGVRTRADAARARARAARATADAVAHDARVRHQKAVSAFENACSRLTLAEESVHHARQALEAENERFSTGDGSSRNVLDAQKDLTNATRQQLAVSLEVVSGAIELRRAAGRPAIDARDANALPPSASGPDLPSTTP